MHPDTACCFNKKRLILPTAAQQWKEKQKKDETTVINCVCCWFIHPKHPTPGAPPFRRDWARHLISSVSSCDRLQAVGGHPPPRRVRSPWPPGCLLAQMLESLEIRSRLHDTAVEVRWTTRSFVHHTCTASCMWCTVFTLFCP